MAWAWLYVCQRGLRGSQLGERLTSISEIGEFVVEERWGWVGCVCACVCVGSEGGCRRLGLEQGGGLSPQDCAVITGLRLHGTSQEWCQLGSLLFANSRGSVLSHKEVRLIPRYGTRRERGDTTEY